MAKKQIKDYIKETVNSMETMGTYRTEYDEVIKIYATLLHDFDLTRAEFEAEGMKVETKTAAGNPKKSAHLSALENIRKDIITYTDRLLLNPKAYSGSDRPSQDTISKLDLFISKHEKI